MTINVSSTGTVSSARFVAASSDEKSIKRRALRSVRSLRFRPRFEEDKAVRVQEMQFLYRFEEAPR
jgi:outer membrane biosynthesis protein TonB